MHATSKTARQLCSHAGSKQTYFVEIVQTNGLDNLADLDTSLLGTSKKEKEQIANKQMRKNKIHKIEITAWQKNRLLIKAFRKSKQLPLQIGYFVSNMLQSCMEEIAEMKILENSKSCATKELHLFDQCMRLHAKISIVFISQKCKWMLLMLQWKIEKASFLYYAPDQEIHSSSQK